MVVGFNHNFKYKGEVFHVQTEDGGLNTTNIITLLYRGGTILARQKTSYSDIAKADNLELVVEELMKEQHKNMLKRLKSGDFDEVIDRMLQGGKTVAEEQVAEVQAPADSETPPEITLVETVVEEMEEAVEDAIPILEEDLEEAEPEFDLDEVILSYLMGDDD
jgi:ketol-acid reductoisomerase